MDNSAAIATALATGDIASLNTEQRGEYYQRVCESLQLNYLTSPLYFQVGEDGRESLAVNKSGAAALRKIHGISIVRTERDISRGLAIFTVYGIDKDQREDSATGVTDLEALSGQRLADAIMGAETKAKNRLTISLSGIGFLDSSEAGKPSAKQVDVSSLQPTESAAAIAAGVNQAPATETTDTRPQDLPGTPVSPVQAQAILKAAETPAAPPAAPAQLVPAQATAAVPVQANTAPPVAEDIPATPAEYAVFVTNRASKLLRDVLQKSSAAKNPNQLLQDWFIRESGKPSLKKISAPTWERMLAMLEGKTAEEIVAILKGGKK